MKRIVELIILALAMASLMMFVGACSGIEDAEDIGISLPSTPDDDDTAVEPDPVEDTPIGEVEDTGFWMNVVSDQFDVIVSKSTDFDEDCFIDTTTTSNEFITCYIDIMEGQLYVQDLVLQYNAPPNMCDIVTTSPAWHWNEDIGRGPTSVTMDVNSSLENPVVTNCDANHTNLGSVTCGSHPELTDVTNPDGPACLYDSSGTEGLNNCCVGDYTLTVNYDEDGDTITDSTVVTETNWGGEYANCFSPYLSNGWDTFAPGGLPSSKIQAVPRDPTSDNPVGLNSAVTLSANGNTTLATLSTWANFYTTASDPHDHQGFYSTSRSSQPYAVEPIDDLSGSIMPSGNEAWTIECQDGALETIHRITVYIREWNTLADYVAFETSGGVTYDPDVTGSEGTGCAYDPLSGDDCNDRWDLDDLLTESVFAGGSYDTTPTTDDAARENYFPNIIY